MVSAKELQLPAQFKGANRYATQSLKSRESVVVFYRLGNPSPFFHKKGWLKIKLVLPQVSSKAWTFIKITIFRNICGNEHFY
jgi:hypothetical protein